MNRYYLYQKTLGGTCVCIKPDQIDGCSGQETQGVNSQLLGVVASEPGIFEVKATGDIPSAGSFLLLPIKGSQQLSLLMEVHEVASLITPESSWSARCSGLPQSDFQLRSLDAHCDRCGKNESIEFLQVTSNLQADALQGLNMFGWRADEHTQICQSCNRGVDER